MKLPEFKPTPWNLMYLGAVVSALICVATVYQITASWDASNEWIAWVFVIVGFFLFGGGYVVEDRYRKDHSDEHPEL